MHVCVYREQGLGQAAAVVVHGDDVHRVVLNDERYSWVTALASFDDVDCECIAYSRDLSLNRASIIVSSFGGGKQTFVIRYSHPSAFLRNHRTDYHLASSLLVLANAVEVQLSCVLCL